MGNFEPLERETAPVSYKQACADFERQLLGTTLARCAGNVPQAAKELGLGRSTLYKKLVALGLSSQY
ncbi:DNA-binding protein Fis [compost metagenome]